jgi:hypothetical protein
MLMQRHQQEMMQQQQMHDQKLGQMDQAAKLQQAIAVAKAKQTQGQQGPAQ